MIKLKVPVSDHDHTKGSKQAPLTLVEYGDFECPFCAMAEPKVKLLRNGLGDNLRLVFRHFPLTQAHPYAFLGAMSAEAAGLQDKFWQMHDLLFDRQELLGPEGVLGFATDLGLDLGKFETNLNNEQLATHIRRDFMGGVRSGVNGTPSFYLNGEKYEGPLEVGVFEELLAA